MKSCIWLSKELEHRKHPRPQLAKLISIETREVPVVKNVVTIPAEENERIMHYRRNTHHCHNFISMNPAFDKERGMQWA